MGSSLLDPTIAPRTRDLVSHTIRYVDHGHGPAVVLIHGLMGNLHDWDPQIAELSQHFRVIAVDLPGHGESDKVPGDYSLSAHAATVRDLLTSLDVDSATVVGHSYGGGVAMQMLYLFPHLVDRICLVASGGLGQEVNPILRVASVPGSGIAIPVAASAPVRGILGGVLGLLSALRIVRLGAGDRRAWANFASVADAPTRRAFLATARSVIDYRGQTVSATRLLQTFTGVPAMLVWGDHDVIIPAVHAHEVRDQLPDGATVEVFPGAGHFPHLDEPELFASVFTTFMSTASSLAQAKRA
ncbi:alpha/beta fold hydrolase [Rhodococcus sp. IEGM 1401]|uniref:alpha/beta fold hydrolase n=1 Tax=unclassified Rhodococcus (in: high G+C Gram-positive bacteria) TaxID=192944 RepID=UPI0022B43AE3|nr:MULTISPECIES: alpha/beta fold hydrolase [unclassified Rhodococcus (in: high G+C Gram-positive bacteria)]MCZ4560871.1 alpha/beta fold hydrolase [Rhodococcus sp. IEGM 1401]MDI9921011.1 alpha/beta fold hydrolase [Rhodococcus sp. IEGM 1372]MDV8033388.1 alpha/beta fold hydrolase [Rhodococcus sp. IEGM 1414]